MRHVIGRKVCFFLIEGHKCTQQKQMNKQTKEEKLVSSSAMNFMASDLNLIRVDELVNFARCIYMWIEVRYKKQQI